MPSPPSLPSDPSSLPARAINGSSKVRSVVHGVLSPLTKLGIGMAYQLIEDDPLVKTEQCERDANLMKELGVNAIRVYHVNETADHQGCMNVFAGAGIYCFIDLDTFHTYIRYVSRRATRETTA